MQARPEPMALPDHKVLKVQRERTAKMAFRRRHNSAWSAPPQREDSHIPRCAPAMKLW